MAQEILELIVRTSGSPAAQSELRAIGSSATSAASSLGGMAESLRVMRNVLVGISFLKAFEGLAAGISQMQQLNNLLTTVTSNTTDQANAFQGLVKAANDVRASVDPFTRFFTNLERSTAGYKLSTQDAIKTTQSFFATFAISGLDENSIRNVTRDMKEVFNLGTVQGRIFRSVVMQDQEASLVLSKYIVATGNNAAKVNAQLDQMRAKGQQPDIYGGIVEGKFRGAFTGGDIQRAFLAASDEEMQKLNKTSLTLGQGFTILQNDWLGFLASLSQSTPVFNVLAQSLVYVGDNLKGILEIAAALAAVFAARYIALPMAIWFYNLAASIAVAIFNMTLFTVTTIGNALTSLGAFILEMGLSTAAVVALNSAIAVGLVLAVGGATAALMGFLAPLLQLAKIGDPLKDLKLTLKDLPTVFAGLVDTILTEWPLITKVMGAMWDDMLNGMKNSWDAWWLSVINKLRTGPLGLFGAPLPEGPQRPTNTAAPLIDQLGLALAKNIGEEQKRTLAPFTTSGNPGAPGPEEDNTLKQMRALEQLQNALAKFGGPMEKFKRDQTDMKVTIEKTTAATSDLMVKMVMNSMGYDDYNAKTMTSAKLTEDMRLKELGMTDALRDAREKQDLYNQALATGDVRLQQYSNQVKHINDLLKDMKENDPSQSAGVRSAILKEDLALMDKASISESTYTKYVLDEVKAQNELTVGLSTLNKALADGQISVEHYTTAVQDMQLAFLKTKTDMLSGFQEGIITVQKEMANASTDASKTVVDAFNNMTDAMTNFFVTGKLNLKSMITSIVTDLDRLAVKQAIMAPLANMLGFGPGQNVTNSGGGIAGGLSQLFGGPANQSSALGTTASQAMWVQSADLVNGTIPGGAFNSGAGASAGGGLGGGGLGGLAGGIGSAINSGMNWLDLKVGGPGMGGGGQGLLSDVGSYLGFANGGEFQVGGIGGTDSQFVTIRATPGENVSVRTPEQMRSGPTQTVNMGGLHLHGVQDADSFMRSKAQITSGVSRMVERAQARSGGGGRR